MVDNHDPFISNSLGGSLMKDLLEDLALGDDDFLSLDQLEKELQEMEKSSHFEAPPTSAAGLIVEQQSTSSMNSMLFDQSSISSLGASASNPSLFGGQPFALPGIDEDVSVKTLDAWSLPLQNFSEAASTLQEDFLQADSARKQQQKQAPTAPPPGLESLPEYDISAPPPGMAPPRAIPPPDLVEQAAERLAATSMHLNEGAADQGVIVSPPPHLQPLQGQFVSASSPPINAPMMTMMSTPPKTTPWNKAPPPPTPFTTPQSSVGFKIEETVARPRIYANPHPTAEPVPATNISSRFMTPRDLCYVVHSILKPILTQNAAEASTYHLEYWMKHHPTAPPVRNQPKGSGNEQELASRLAKATEWSKENKVLGNTVKNIVTRPRALIAVVPTQEEEKENDDDQQKRSNQHRAALWKARVRCDQGYACFTQLHSASARIKLLKCFGVQNGSLNESIFQGVLKLAKGRALLARTLEQYAEVIPILLLPATLSFLAGDPPVTDNRLCAAWARVIANTSDETVANQSLFLTAIEIVVDRGNVILQDTSHMMIAHALLQRAGAAATKNASFGSQYAPLEAKFMELLSSL